MNASVGSSDVAVWVSRISPGTVRESAAKLLDGIERRDQTVVELRRALDGRNAGGDRRGELHRRRGEVHERRAEAAEQLARVIDELSLCRQLLRARLRAPRDRPRSRPAAPGRV